jgi:geranylgeranyl diphosphate synthase type II
VKMTGAARDAYLEASRVATLEVISALLTEEERRMPAYASVLDYPLREGKGLRPALALAMGQALGASAGEVLPTASVLELYHNAFLVHDDIEDGSLVRRGKPTLPVQIGLPLAVHTGDTMLALALAPLLDNMRLLDLGRALRLLDLVARVSRRTAEGQALELTWIHERRWNVSEEDYVEMVTLKTGWYTFAAPLLAGAIVARAPDDTLARIQAFALDLGVAFQIQDDLLNLSSDERTMGKEAWGDLWEGKRTLVLSSLFARATDEDVAFATAVLEKERPSAEPAEERTFDALVADLVATGVADEASLRSRFATRARASWDGIAADLTDSPHKSFLESIVDFVVHRSS